MVAQNRRELLLRERAVACTTSLCCICLCLCTARPKSMLLSELLFTILSYTRSLTHRSCRTSRRPGTMRRSCTSHTRKCYVKSKLMCEMMNIAMNKWDYVRVLFPMWFTLLRNSCLPHETETGCSLICF